MSDDDQIESRLRRALNSEAAMVKPTGDGLQNIRGDIDGRRRGAWWRSPAMALVAAAALGLTAGGLFFGLRDDGGTSAVPPATSESPTDLPSDAPSTSPSPSPSSSTATEDVYVYYVQASPEGPKLYREQHSFTAQLTGDGSPGELAVDAMFGQDPTDPDYESPWPPDVKVLNYHQDADTVTVDLSEFLKAGSTVEKAGVQQLVYTITANDPSVKKVMLRVQGTAPKGHNDWSHPIQRAPMVDVQAFIWILAPTQGASVSSPVTIDGYGTAFEGTISWEVRKDGVVLQQGHTQGGSNGEFDEFHGTVTLAPGDYELTAFESSAKDGSPIHIDTKNITVK
jgi:hypothetical protein